MAKRYLTDGFDEKGILQVLRGIVESLNREPDIQKGGLYHTLQGAMQDRLVKMNVINVPEVMLLMQELGLLRHWGGGKANVWQVICATFFTEVVSEAWLLRAQACLEKRSSMMDTLRSLREQVSKTEPKKDEGGPAAGDKSLDAIAEMVVRIEQLEATVVSKDEHIAMLSDQLAKSVCVDYDAALASAIKKARERLHP